MASELNKDDKFYFKLFAIVSVFFILVVIFEFLFGKRIYTVLFIIVYALVLQIGLMVYQIELIEKRRRT